jgi:hypothetical protein
LLLARIILAPSSVDFTSLYRKREKKEKERERERGEKNFYFFFFSIEKGTKNGSILQLLI